MQGNASLLRFFIAALAFFALTALVPGIASAQIPPAAPDGLTRLGSRTDCLTRVNDAKYCDGLFDALAYIEEFWGENFADLVPRGQTTKYAKPNYYFYRPSVTLANINCALETTRGSFCVPAYYEGNSREKFIAINEPRLRALMEEASGGVAELVLAHEAALHVQDLLGVLKTDESKRFAFSLPSELLADCYAGWTFGEADADDVDEVATLGFFQQAKNMGIWQDEKERGDRTLRALAFRTGWVFEDAATCATWGKYAAKDDVWQFAKYDFALPPTWQFDELAGGQTLSVTIDAKTSLSVRSRSDVTGAAAGELTRIMGLYDGGRVTMLEKPDIGNVPLRGEVAERELQRSTSAIQRLEVNTNGTLTHGVVYLHVRSGGGGIILVVLTEGPARGADWRRLDNLARQAILGLSLR